jgi:hypothetical protein
MWLNLPYDLISLGSSIKIVYAFLITPANAKYLAHVIRLDKMAHIVFGGKYKIWN